MKAKKKNIKPEEFFKQVALNAGVVDLQNVKDIYYGMIRTISRELKATHRVRLPDWGDFYFTLCKSRRFFDINAREFKILPPKKIIRFKSTWKVKEHFYDWGNDS